MTIEGQRSSTTYSTNRARQNDKATVLNSPLAVDGEIWPCGLLVEKVDANSDWSPLGAIGTGIIGVLDEDTDTSEASSGLVLRLGPVKLKELKVGVAAQAAPGNDYLFALEKNHIFAN